MSFINPLSTTNAQINIESGTGPISIGSDAAAKVITIGSSLGSLTLNAAAGELKLPSLSAFGAVVSTSAGAVSTVSSSTAGYVLTSNGASALPSFQPASGGGGMTFSSVSANTQMQAGAGYIANSASLCELTLPATAAVGSLLTVVGEGAGGWRIAQNASQQVQIGSAVSTAGTAGYVESENRYDSINLVCVIANTKWASVGAPLSAGLDLV